jgi:hypothetical protein
MALGYNDEKPSLQELKHYGVKGMHWGQHKRSAFGDIVKSVESDMVANKFNDPKHPTGSQIRDARSRVTAQRKAIRSTKKDIRKGKRRGEDITGKKSELSKMTTDLLRNPDRITASRMTKGEATVSLIFGDPGSVAGAALKTKLIELEVNQHRNK